jgi:hypothetical protein
MTASVAPAPAPPAEPGTPPVRGRQLPQYVAIGSVWVSLMEPEPGSDAAFNRWYGDDHFYAGGMGLAWIFAGRRWVCTRDLQALRYAREGTAFAPVDAGRFLHLNFFSAGHVDEAAPVLGETIARLAGEGRMYVDTIPRRHVFSRLQPYAGVVYADPYAHGPLDVHALDFPFTGVVVEVLRTRAGRDRAELVRWLTEDFLPAQLPAARAAMCLVSLDADLPDSVAARTSRVPSAYGDEAAARLTLLWFVQDDVAQDWAGRFAGHAEALAAAGLGDLEFASPFRPLVPGTDRYVDELR